MKAGLPGRPVRGVVCREAVLASRRMAGRSALGLTGLPGAPADAGGRSRARSRWAGGRQVSAT